MQAEIVKATLDHALYIAAHVRGDDKRELWASHMLSPLAIMEIGLKIGESFTFMVNGVPVCMFGVHKTSVFMSPAVVWMVSSTALDERKVAISFIKHCRPQVMAFTQKYGMIENYVDSRYLLSIRWLKWLGFTFDENAVPYGALGVPFYRFYMRE